MLPLFTTGLTGIALVSVIDHEGRTVRELPPIRNLWLDQGLDRLATVLIPEAFSVAVKGSGQAVVKETPANTNTYTLASTTLTRTAGARDFTADDVGKLVRSTDGKEGVISLFTDATHVELTGVGLNNLVNFTNKAISLYSVSLKGLTGEAYTRTDAAITIDKADANQTVTASGAFFVAGDVGKALFVGGDEADPYAERYSITGYTSATVATVDRAAGEFTGRRAVVYTPQAGDVTLTPISRTSITSAVIGENSTTDTLAAGLLTGERQLKRTFIFSPEPSVIEVPAGGETYTWNATTVTRTAGVRNFTTDDVGKYLKFADAEFCKITARTSNTVVTVDRAPAATITSGGGVSIYGFASYDGIAFSDSDDPDANANILIRLENAGTVTPVLVGGANPELPGQQLKVTYICKASVAPVTATARALAGITDTANVMSTNKFGQSVVEGLALASIDSSGETQSNFAVLEPSVAGFLGISSAGAALQPLKQPDRSPGAQSVEMTASGYTDGDFSQLYEGTFGINDAIASNWRVVGIFDPDTNAFGYTWLFEANQAKTGQVILTIRFRKSWNRDLS